MTLQCVFSCVWVFCPVSFEEHKKPSILPSQMLNDSWLSCWWFKDVFADKIDELWRAFELATGSAGVHALHVVCKPCSRAGSSQLYSKTLSHYVFWGS